MDLDTLLADPALDLPVPADGLARVHRKARSLRRRRRAFLCVPVLAVGAFVPPLVGGDGHRTELTATKPPPPASFYLQNFCPAPAYNDRTDVMGPTGNPVTNCGFEWRRETGQPAPAMKAYQDHYGNVQVYLADADLPGDLRPLPSGNVLNTEAIVIAEYLDDTLNGLRTRCLTEAQAGAKARALVAGLGYEGWPVKRHQPTAGVTYPSSDPTARCWSGGPDPRDHTVRLDVGQDAHADYTPAYFPMIEPLRASTTECWNRQKALAEVHDAIERSAFSATAKAGFDIQTVDEPTRCTTIHVVGGGNVIFVLRGPA